MPLNVSQDTGVVATTADGYSVSGVFKNSSHLYTEGRYNKTGALCNGNPVYQMGKPGAGGPVLFQRDGSGCDAWKGTWVVGHQEMIGVACECWIGEILSSTVCSADSPDDCQGNWQEYPVAGCDDGGGFCNNPSVAVVSW